jgi:hypothetical protein
MPSRTRPIRTRLSIGSGSIVSRRDHIDHLLSSHQATTVPLHVKPYPYYISDATTADLIACLRRLSGRHRKSVGGRELDVTDISVTANVGGVEFTTRTIAAQVVPGV